MTFSPSMTVPCVSGYKLLGTSGIAMTLGELCKACANSVSPPSLSGCGNNTTQPTPSAPFSSKVL